MRPADPQHNEQGSWAIREIDHLFGRFARYTRFVMYSKWSLLVIAGVLTLSLIIWPLVSKDKSGLRVSFVDHNSVKMAPESPVMSNPVYTGSGADGREYKVTGTRAVQQTPTLIVLEHVEAQLTKPDGAWYMLSAQRADYDREKKRIDFSGDVTVNDAKASTFTTGRATLETDTMHIFGNDPVVGESLSGKLNASGFDISDKGNHIVFVGGARQLSVIIERKK